METPAAGRSSASAEPARGGEPDPHPGEAARPDPDGERVDVARVRPGLAQERVDVREQRRRARDPLAEHLAVADERARGAVSRRVEGEDQRRSLEGYAALDRDSPAPLVDVLEPDGRAHRGSPPPAASGHSTKTTASSKYGSRSPHSADETAVKR